MWRQLIQHLQIILSLPEISEKPYAKPGKLLICAHYFLDLLFWIDINL